MINPVKAIVMPRNRGIKDRNALVIDRNVPERISLWYKVLWRVLNYTPFFQGLNFNPQTQIEGRYKSFYPNRKIMAQ